METTWQWHCLGHTLRVGPLSKESEHSLRPIACVTKVGVPGVEKELHPSSDRHHVRHGLPPVGRRLLVVKDAVTRHLCPAKERSMKQNALPHFQATSQAQKEKNTHGHESWRSWHPKTSSPLPSARRTASWQTGEICSPAAGLKSQCMQITNNQRVTRQSIEHWNSKQWHSEPTKILMALSVRGQLLIGPWLCQHVLQADTALPGHLALRRVKEWLVLACNLQPESMAWNATQIHTDRHMFLMHVSPHRWSVVMQGNADTPHRSHTGST